MMEVFETCSKINDMLEADQEHNARNELIKLLDYLEQNELPYTELINHLIRCTGLYPYLETETASWQDKFVYEAFKVDTGGKEAVTLHREQSSLLSRLIDGESLAVSAPTSFGKSFVIDAYISIRKPKNVMIIVPTLALTDETRRRLYKKFATEYKIITTVDVKLAEKNIMIFPQERAINYVERLKEIDLLIVDEFYKASASFDKERSPILVKAILQLGKIAKQKYFLAPNIKVLTDNPFTEGMEFFPLDFNTVYLEKYDFSDEIKNSEEQKSIRLLEILGQKKTKTLIYAGTYSNIDELGNLLLTNLQSDTKPLLNDFADWLSTNYSYNWNLTKLVSRGVGIHNGKLHRSLTQIQVKLFEESDGLDCFLSTSSIIEGVNTSTENVVIWSNRKGAAKLDDFTYKNIMGRGGRMFKHFVGKVFILAKPPEEEATQLDISFPEQILGQLDEKKYSSDLSKEQLAKIVFYKEEMAKAIGEGVLEKIQAEYTFQTADTDLIRKIAYDMRSDPASWNGLGFLNSFNADWDRLLYKIIRLSPSGWEASYSQVVGFIKILRNNWSKSIPELLSELEEIDIGIDDFFKLERKVTFKLASLLSDINAIQKEILKRDYDITRFINWISNAFLPPLVYQLEEFGLPRMIAKRIQAAQIFDFYQSGQEIDDALQVFKNIGSKEMGERLNLQGFDRYIFDYFFEGLSAN